MLVEMAQAVQEAAKQGSVTIAIPTAFLSSAATLLLYKGVPALVNVVRGKPKNGNPNCPKPGEGKICGDHSDAIQEQGKEIASQKKAQENTETSLKRIEGKVDALPFELIKILREGK
jgi:hypothetical protein